MRIAIPVEVQSGNAATLAESFSGAGHFSIYDVDNETRAVGYVGRESTAEACGCEGRAEFLKGRGVEVVMTHALSEGAQQHLLEAGILAIKDAPILPPDALIMHLVSGTLRATPPGAGEEAVGQSASGCGGHGGCGHCGGSAHAAACASEGSPADQG